MSKTDDPVAFLLAALDRAEVDARYSEDGDMFFDTGDAALADHYQNAGSPASVLRLVAAERKLLAEHQPGDNESGVYDTECSACWGPDSIRGECVVSKPWPCPTLLDRAAAWGWDGGS